ncbi:T9SS type A sorting domain-containing protein [Flavobacterium ovatum]|uniref:T9SS type A sorting domain-containing protein n=1 Tax=Flavobacterium ovatum TaxID=1928857 RepID=UPI00344F4EB6
MKTQLLKKMIMVVAFFAMTSASAQLFDFESSKGGWDKEFQMASADLVIEGGRGTLACVRTTNNSTIALAPATATINAKTMNFLKLVIKNTSKSNSIRVKAQTSAATDNTANFNISAEDTEFQTYYFDLRTTTAWTAAQTANSTTEEVKLLFRGNFPTAPAVEGIIYVDSIEFLAAIPATQYSEFIQNPNFEDPTGITQYSGNGATRSISSVGAQAGLQSMKVTFTAAQTSNFWNFSNYKKTYAPGFLTGKTAIVKVWVKTNRTTAAQINVKLKTVDASDAVTANQPQVTQLTTNFTGGWEELTFSLPLLDANVEGITFFLGVNWNDPAAIPDNSAYNAVAGNNFYFDTMSATFSTTLGTAKNTLEGVSVYPNPADDVVNVNSVNGGDITVYSTVGTKVLTAKATASNYQLNVSGLSSGVYLLELVSVGKTSVTKLVIK